MFVSLPSGSLSQEHAKQTTPQKNEDVVSFPLQTGSQAKYGSPQKRGRLWSIIFSGKRRSNPVKALGLCHGLSSGPLAVKEWLRHTKPSERSAAITGNNWPKNVQFARERYPERQQLSSPQDRHSLSGPSQFPSLLVGGFALAMSPAFSR